VPVLVTVVAAVVAGAWLRPPADPADAPVARVNRARVTERDVAIRLSELLPMASFHGNLAPSKLLALRRTALEELVLEELMLQEASAAGLTPAAPAVDEEVARARQRFGSDTEFERALGEIGLTPALFRRYMARAVLVRRVQEAHVPPVPTDADARTYYERNASKFVRPARVHLLEILTAIDPAGGRAAERRAAAKANDLLRQLRTGADFGALARTASEDAYRVKYGDVGWVHRGRLDPDLEAAVFAAPLDRVRVARSLSGIHVFTVIAREPERQLTFDEARTSILERLGRERRDSARAAWHARLRQRARVEILDMKLAGTEPATIPGVPLGLPDGAVTATAPSP